MTETETSERWCPICGLYKPFKVVKGREAVAARGSSHVEALESSHVVAWESSHVVARESSHVVARGSSHVEARGSSHVVARGSSHVVAWESSHVVALSSYASVLAKSSLAVVPQSALGRKALTALEWLAACGVTIKRGTVILYKSTEKDFTTRNGILFKPGTTHEAPDWDASFTGECGAGIHYCPTVAQARIFRDCETYIACRVKVSDMAGLPAFAEYPDKIRAKGGKALYQVDASGNRLKVEATK